MKDTRLEDYKEKLARNKTIYQRRKNGESFRSIGDDYGLSHVAILKICREEEKYDLQK